MSKPLSPEDGFRYGDLVRFGHAKYPVTTFARVFRVHQSWLEFIPGEFGALKRDCVLVERPREICA